MTISNYKISLTFLHNSKSIDHYKKQAMNHQLLDDSIDYKLVAVNYFVLASYIYRLKLWDNEQSNTLLFKSISPRQRII